MASALERSKALAQLGVMQTRQDVGPGVFADAPVIEALLNDGTVREPDSNHLWTRVQQRGSENKNFEQWSGLIALRTFAAARSYES